MFSKMHRRHHGPLDAPHAAISLPGLSNPQFVENITQAFITREILPALAITRQHVATLAHARAPAFVARRLVQGNLHSCLVPHVSCTFSIVSPHCRSVAHRLPIPFSLSQIRALDSSLNVIFWTKFRAAFRNDGAPGPSIKQSSSVLFPATLALCVQHFS